MTVGRYRIDTEHRAGLPHNGSVALTMAALAFASQIDVGCRVRSWGEAEMFQTNLISRSLPRPDALAADTLDAQHT